MAKLETRARLHITPTRAARHGLERKSYTRGDSDPHDRLFVGECGTPSVVWFAPPPVFMEHCSTFDALYPKALTTHPAWKGYRVSGGYTVTPWMEEEGECSAWLVQAPFGKADMDGDLDSAIEDGIGFCEDIPPATVASLTRLRDRLVAAGIY